MPKIIWDAIGQRFYETGVDHGVLYTPDETGAYTSGVAWNGLTSVSESPSGAEANAQYADNIKYLNLISAEEFGATIEAFTYPPEFAPFDGLGTPSDGIVIGQQPRKSFGLCYRTKVGNDLEGDNHGYKLHLVYGCQASPSEKAYNTINDSPEAITFSWEITTTPVPVTGFTPTSLLVIDSTLVDAAALATLEDMLYGETGSPTLPTPDDVLAIFPAGDPSAGATAGTPGTWTPAGTVAPSSVSNLTAGVPQPVVASPNTAWTTGQYVQTGTAGVGGQAHWDGTAWVAGPAA